LVLRAQVAQPDESQLDPVGALLSIVGVSTLVFG